MRNSAVRLIHASLAAATLSVSTMTAAVAQPGCTQTGPAQIASYGRTVADLDTALKFYRQIGFTMDGAGDSGWKRDVAVNQLLGTAHVKSRTARLTITSHASGQPFEVVLRQLRDIKQTSAAGRQPWMAGNSHFALIAPDAERLWTALSAAGMLRARSWDAKLIAPPGKTKGLLAYMTDPDNMDIELIDRSLIPAPASAAVATERSELQHVGLVVLHSDVEIAFYQDLFGGKPRDTESPWRQGDFFDSVVGGHGNVLRFVNEMYPEPKSPDTRTAYELVEYQNQRAPAMPLKITDIGVSWVGFKVSDIGACITAMRAHGATVLSTQQPVSLGDGTRAVMLKDPDTGFLEVSASTNH